MRIRTAARSGLALVRQPQGKLAHAAVLEHQPDVVVMDIGLPTWTAATWPWSPTQLKRRTAPHPEYMI